MAGAIDDYLKGLRRQLAPPRKAVDVQDPSTLVQYDDSIFEDGEDVDYPVFVFKKPMVSKMMYYNLPWEMQKMHDWYMLTSKEGVDLITCKIPSDIFNDEGDHNVPGLYFNDLHAMYRLEKMDMTFITLWCM